LYIFVKIVIQPKDTTTRYCIGSRTKLSIGTHYSKIGQNLIVALHSRSNTCNEISGLCIPTHATSRSTSATTQNTCY